MLQELQRYYIDNGILSTTFSCRFRGDCQGDCETFTGPKSAFVSSGYAEHEYPRLLFLSLDSGSGDPIAENRLPVAVRRHEEWERDFESLHKHKHWYRTHELAWYVLRQFHPRLKIGEARRFFAHANSAKCCMNKKQRKKADKKLFANCRGYLQGELRILDPDIFITQGNEAKFAFSSMVQNAPDRVDDFASVVTFNQKPIFWLHTYHPNNWGAFNKQRDFDEARNVAVGWSRYASMIHSFMTNR